MKAIVKQISAILLLVVISLFFSGHSIKIKLTSEMEELGSNPNLYVCYYPSGSLKCIYNRKTFRYISYYPSGVKEETGYWMNNRNVGEFTRFYKNGNTWHKFQFNVSGKKEGKQVYYHSNGNVALKTLWNEGEGSGNVIRFYKNGHIKYSAIYAQGKVDASTIRKYVDRSVLYPNNTQRKTIQF